MILLMGVNQWQIIIYKSSYEFNMTVEVRAQTKTGTSTSPFSENKININKQVSNVLSKIFMPTLIRTSVDDIYSFNKSKRKYEWVILTKI